MLFHRLNHLCILLCACGLMVGCGSNGPDLVPAGGVVNFNGKPIGKINVMLMPGAGGMIAEGTTDASGKFTLQTQEPGDGAMIGNYTVAFNFVPEEVPVMPGFAGAKKVVSPIPEKYADASKSGLTATVVADKSKNNFIFDLK